MSERRKIGRMGSLVLLGVGAMLSVALISPAVAHYGPIAHLWQKHIRPKADVRYLESSNVYVSDPVTVASGDTGTATVDCPAGRQAVGGGVDSDADAISFSVTASGPTIGGDVLLDAVAGKNPRAGGWSATVENLDLTASHDFAVGVICSR